MPTSPLHGLHEGRPRGARGVAQREKLRQEYLGLGGAANSKMGSNWFLNISLFIAFLAVFVKLTGTIDL